MSWEVREPDGTVKRFPSQDAAQTYINNKLRALRGSIGRHAAREWQHGLDVNHDANQSPYYTTETFDVPEGASPTDVWINQFREHAASLGYEVSDIQISEGDLGKPEFGAKAERFGLSYKLTPMDFGALGLMDTPGKFEVGNDIMQWLNPMTWGQQFLPELYREITDGDDSWNPFEQFAETREAVIDYDPYKQQVGISEEIASPYEGLEGLDADMIQAKREYYEAKEAERELFAVSNMVSQGALPGTARQVWEDARKYGDSETASHRLVTGGLGSAVAGMHERERARTGNVNARNSTADRILESEMNMVQPGPDWVFEGGGRENGPQVNTDFGPPGGYYGGGGYGGGGGFSYPEPVYEPPDRREVEDQVRGILAALVGVADDPRVQRLTDKYMSAHKRAWDSPEIGLEPRYDVIEDIRDAADYKHIHALRPDTTDETEWIANRLNLGINAGLSDQMAQGFAVTQATVGAAEADVADAASITKFAATGLSEGTFFDRIARNAANMLGSVR